MHCEQAEENRNAYMTESRSRGIQQPRSVLIRPCTLHPVQCESHERMQTVSTPEAFAVTLVPSNAFYLTYKVPRLPQERRVENSSEQRPFFTERAQWNEGVLSASWLL